MSGETEAQPSGWTVDTALRHMQKQHDDLVTRLDERKLSQDREVQAALAAAKEAVSKAEAATDKRFDSVNEFRGTLSDLTRTLMPRQESEARFKTIEDRVGVGAALDSTSQGYHAATTTIKKDTLSVVAIAVSIISVIVIALIAFLT